MSHVWMSGSYREEIKILDLRYSLEKRSTFGVFNHYFIGLKGLEIQNNIFGLKTQIAGYVTHNRSLEITLIDRVSVPVSRKSKVIR